MLASCCLRCAPAVNCFLKNDGMHAFKGVVNVSWVSLTTGAIQPAHQERVSVGTLDSDPSGPIHRFGVGAFPNVSLSLMRIEVFRDTQGVLALLSQEDMLLAPPKHLALPQATVTAVVSSSLAADGSATITLSASAPAVGVILTTLCQGRFSDNLIVVLPQTPRVVSFLPFDDDVDVAELRSTLRIEHAQEMQ